jgi:hypothetical protein
LIKLDGVMNRQCATCPFRSDGKGYTEVANLLMDRALSEATPICHSTGDSDVTPKSKKVSRKNLACRGARDLQLKYFCAMGVLKEPTDEAWEKKWKEISAENGTSKPSRRK